MLPSEPPRIYEPAAPTLPPPHYMVEAQQAIKAVREWARLNGLKSKLHDFWAPAHYTGSFTARVTVFGCKATKSCPRKESHMKPLMQPNYDIDQELDLTPDAAPSDRMRAAVNDFVDNRDRLLGSLFDPVEGEDDSEEEWPEHDD